MGIHQEEFILIRGIAVVLIVTALMLEAKPLIKHFKLKKDVGVTAYQVFRNDGIALIVSGVGKTRSAMAAVYLISGCKGENIAAILNVGFCGSGSKAYEPGQLLAANKVTDTDTGFDYYPDVYTGAGIPRTPICCHSRPVSSTDPGLRPGTIADMESAGIMEAAKRFLLSHQVVILKIVSDPLTPDKIDKDLLTCYMRTNAAAIEKVVTELQKINDGLNANGFKGIAELVDRLSGSLRFTKSMRDILLKSAKRAKTNGLDPAPILETYLKGKTCLKTEGKKVFDSIIKDLRA